MEIDTSEAIQDAEIETDGPPHVVNESKDSVNTDPWTEDTKISDSTNSEANPKSEVSIKDDDNEETPVKLKDEAASLDEDEKKEVTNSNTGNDLCETNQIEVIVPITPLSANEVSVECYSGMCLFMKKFPLLQMLLYKNQTKNSSLDHKYLRVTSDTLNGTSSPPPPPPPPPPKRPTMTHLVSTHCIILPNGQKLPPGTEQLIVHPYPTSHPFSENFLAENFEKAYDRSLNFNLSEKPTITPTNVNSQGANFYFANSHF